MPELPESVAIKEEGPREGFQFEKGPIPTARKIELIDSLSRTGLKDIQIVSFVPGRNVSGMADADEVVAGIRKAPGVTYTGMWLNEKGLMRTLASGLDVKAGLMLTASETFLKRNQNCTMAENVEAARRMAGVYVEHGVFVQRVSVAAAFGCNFEGDVPRSKVIELLGRSSA